MSDTKPRRRHRYLLVALLTLVLIPVLAIIISNIFFLAGSIPQEKLTPPAKLLTLKPDSNTARPAPIPPAQGLNRDTLAQQKNFLEYCKSRTPNARNLQILAKWESRMQSIAEDYGKVFNSQINGKYTAWVEGQPINADQAKWLRDHAEFIKDLIDLAGAGGFPEISCEQAASLTDEQLANIMNPFYLPLYQFAKILAAEARRRLDTGDFAGAGEIALAVSRLARSADEPALMSISVATHSFGRAEFGPCASCSRAASRSKPQNNFTTNSTRSRPKTFAASWKSNTATSATTPSNG